MSTEVERLAKFLRAGSFVTKGQAGSGKTTMMSACINSYRLFNVYKNSPKGNLAALRYRKPEVLYLRHLSIIEPI